MSVPVTTSITFPNSIFQGTQITPGGLIFADHTTGVITSTPALTNGQTLIGVTGSNPVLGNPLVSPMTTVGDMIVGGVSGAVSRLAAGATNAILQISSGTPAWNINITIPGTLTVVGATALQSTLVVTGTSTFNGNVTVSNSSTFGIGTFSTVGIVTNNSSGIFGSNTANATLMGLLGTGTANNTTFLRGDGSWQVVSGGSGSGSANTRSINQANSFALGACVYNAGGTWTLSDNVTAPHVDGVVTTTGNPFILTMGGLENSITALSANTQYYLGTSGALTPSAPVGLTSFLVPVLRTGIAGDGTIEIGAPASLAKILGNNIQTQLSITSDGSGLKLVGDAAPSATTYYGTNSGSTLGYYAIPVTASNTVTFSGKTIDTTGGGNVLSVNGTSLTSITGTGAVVLAASPTLTSPNIGNATAGTMQVNSTIGIGGASLTRFGIFNGVSVTSNSLAIGGIVQTNTYTYGVNAQAAYGVLTGDTLIANSFTGLAYYNIYLGTPTLVGPGTITNAYQLYITQAATTSGGTTVTNSYGIYQFGSDPNVLTGTLSLLGMSTAGIITNNSSGLLASTTAIGTLGPLLGTSWTNTTTKFLRADGSWSVVSGSGSSANPSATIGLSAVNGVATTFMTSDSAPPLGQGIAPTWTGAHTFSTNVVTISGNQSFGPPTTTGAAAISVPTATYTISGSQPAYTNGSFFGPPVISAATSLTLADFGTVTISGPATVGGAGPAAITRPHSLMIVDATSAASSITGAFLVAATPGTTSTAVGIGNGNINAGSAITAGTTMSASGLIKSTQTNTNPLIGLQAFNTNTGASASIKIEATNSADSCIMAMSSTSGSAAALVTNAGTGEQGALYTTQGFLSIGTVGTLSITIDTSQNITCAGLLKVLGGTNPVLTTTSAVTSGGASGAGTITNAPTNGNPTKWIPFSDNGTTRYFPAW